MFSKHSTDKVTRLPAPRHDQVNGLLDKGCAFEGKLTFDGTVQINGDFRGEVCSDGTLVIGSEARVKANIFVDVLVVYGKLEGQIEAKSRIEMHVPAVVTADLKARNLSVENGVIFQGTCQMDRKNDLVASPHDATVGSIVERDGDEGPVDEEDVLVI